LKDEIKVTLIGAGSIAFTPSLLKGFAQSELSEKCKLTVALMDIDPKILETMYKIGTCISEYAKRRGKAEGLKIEKHGDRKVALEGADFVTVTISVGGAKATHMDVEIPKTKGILQSIGDTVGPAGVFRSLRHVPVMLDIARDMEDICPDAFMFNYTNPLTPLTRAVQRESKIKCYGLCSGPGAARSALAQAFDVKPEEVEAYVAGINHLFWVKDFTIKGEEGYRILKEKIARGEVPRFDPMHFQLYKVFGLLPSVGIGHHVAEFFPNLFMHKEAIEQYKIALDLKGTIYDYEVRDHFDKMLNDIISGKKAIDSLEVGEEATAITLMMAIVLGKSVLFPGINLPNLGIIPNLPPWGTLEVPAYIDPMGVHPFGMGSFPKGIAEVLSDRLHQYEVTIDAALTGDRSLALQALLMDGYVRSINVAERLLDEIIRVEKDWLPDVWHKG
jgi:alpha-galactosidase